MPKNIVLLSDGTGNSAAKLFKTNIWRLYEALELSNPDRQVAYYDNGVGTSSFKPLAILGGVFGVGLKRNVLAIYSFLCRSYEDGDRIYGFGFSRGAFTMRIVASLVAHEGLVPWNDNEAELARNAKAAYRRFRRRFHTSFRMEAIFRCIRDAFLPRLVDPAFRPNIQFLGVWDTVDAYGGPIEEITRAIDYWLWPLSMQDRIMSNKIRRACHALALDDERRAFWPVLWEEDVVHTDAGARPILENWSPPANAGPLPAIDQQRLSQVWFTGMHSDVGGGYPQDGLSHVTLDWMMSRALVYGLLLKRAETAELRRRANENDKLNDSRHGLGGYYRYQPRKVATLCAGDPVKPDIFHDLHYLWRTLKNLGAHDPQSDVDNGLRASSVYSPMIYQSVFKRIIKGVDGYSPIVLPANYRVVSRNGDVVSGLYESASQAEERARRQERVWNWVWGRRVVYFLTVFVSLALVATPILLLRWPGNGEASFAALLIPVIDLIAKFLPSITSYWTDAFKEAPTWLLLNGIALAGLLFLGGRLQRRIFDRMRPLWNANLGAPPLAVPEFPLPNDGLYRIRSLMVYRGFFYSLTHWILPALFLFIILYGGFVAASRLLFAVADSLGFVCASNATVNELQDKATINFSTNEVCQPTNVSVTKDRSYRVTVTVGESWEDGHNFTTNGKGIETDPNGFDRAKMTWKMAIGLPLRRLLGENWFRTVVRVGSRGLNEQALTMTPALGTDRAFTATFTASSDGEIYFFVNDAVIGVPWIAGIFYRNNKGDATITIEPTQ